MAIYRHSAPIAELAAARRLSAYGLPLKRGSTRKGMVAPTLHDGLGVDTHDAIKKLQKAHLQAKSLLVGKEIIAWRGLPEHAAHDIAADQRLIERTLDVLVLLLGPPFVGHAPAIDAEVKRLGMVEVLCKHRSRRLRFRSSQSCPRTAPRGNPDAKTLT